MTMIEQTKDQPLLTFALFAYNQERFIAEAVQGALSQIYSPLEIILSDDCSKDRTFEIMQQTATRCQHPHDVIVRRNDRNLGIGAHINQVMELARGQLIVAAAGDDISLPNRTKRIWESFLKSGCNAFSLFSNEYIIDEIGNIRGLTLKDPPSRNNLTIEWFALQRAFVIGSSHAWHRNTFEIFGPIGETIVNEDAVIPFRSLLLGKIEYIDEPLVMRRFTGSNLSLDSFEWRDKRASARNFILINESNAKNYIAVFENKYRDIDIIIEKYPSRYLELISYKETVEKVLDKIRAEKVFWESSNSHKIKVLIFEFIAKGLVLSAIRIFLYWMIPVFFMHWNHIITLNQRKRFRDSVINEIK